MLIDMGPSIDTNLRTVFSTAEILLSQESEKLLPVGRCSGRRRWMGIVLLAAIAISICTHRRRIFVRAPLEYLSRIQDLILQKLSGDFDAGPPPTIHGTPLTTATAAGAAQTFWVLSCTRPPRPQGQDQVQSVAGASTATVDFDEQETLVQPEEHDLGQEDQRKLPQYLNA